MSKFLHDDNDDDNDDAKAIANYNYTSGGQCRSGIRLHILCSLIMIYTVHQS